jgi:hypothetical protein
LRRRVFGKLVGRGRHLVQGWMMLTSGRLMESSPLYLHSEVMPW